MSNILELPMGIDPEIAARIELKQPQKKIDIDDQAVVNQWQDFYRIANDIRKPRWMIWTSAWDLYNGRYDWTGKEDWQAKINIPKVRGVVDKATAAFKKALIRMKRFYHIESETRLGIEKGMFTMSLIDYWLDQINFIEEFTTGLKAGLITSTLVYKVWWKWVTDYEPRFENRTMRQPVTELGIKVGEQIVQVEEIVRTARTRGILGFKAVDPFNFWMGPRDLYKIEKATVDMAYIWEMVEKGVYSRDAAETLSTRTGQAVDAYLEAVRKGEHPDTYMSKYVRPVDIYHYWGDLYNDEGKIIQRNVTYTVAGSSTGGGGSGYGGGADIVLRKPTSTPFMHGRDPYVVGTPYIVPFSTYHRGIVEDIIGIAKMITELSCLIIDGAQFDALQAYEIDVDLLDDARQAKRGVYPGVAFTTKSFENPTNKNVVRTITTGKVPNLALNVLNFLDREQQLASSVTNALKGQSVGAETLGEFQSLTSAASDSLDDAARTVEETCLDDLLDRIAGTIYQYHNDYTLPRLVENFPKTTLLLADMEPEERYATMIGGFAFKARGVSIFLDKAQDLQKVSNFVQLIGNIPGLLTRINIDEMLEQIIIAMGWNPARMLLQPSTQPVIPAGVQAGQPMPAGPNGMPMSPQQAGGFPSPADRANLTPAQIVAGQRGAQEGGRRNNPQSVSR